MDKKIHLSQFQYKAICFLQTIIVLFGLITIFLACFKTAIVPSASMYPTLHIREFLFCVQGDDYDYDDIVIFHPTAETKTFYVKRVLGKGGDVMAVRDGKLYRNGKVILSDYTNEQKINYTMNPVTVPEDSYFMMGDNRNYSDDSHIIGTISKAQCVARVVWHGIPSNWETEWTPAQLDG